MPCRDFRLFVHQHRPQFQIPRHRVTILTKCHFLVTDGGPSQEGVEDEDLRDYVNQSGLSRQAIFNQVAGSLERLGTDYIDLLQIHRCDLENVSAEVRLCPWVQKAGDDGRSRRRR
jgi:aryl-alcohol dehydrogenase-like predicted oxidoreductase